MNGQFRGGKPWKKWRYLYVDTATTVYVAIIYAGTKYFFAIFPKEINSLYLVTTGRYSYFSDTEVSRISTISRLQKFRNSEMLEPRQKCLKKMVLN